MFYVPGPRSAVVHDQCFSVCVFFLMGFVQCGVTRQQGKLRAQRRLFVCSMA